MIRRTIGWVDNRLGGSNFTKTALRKVFPDHWSFMIGEVALYCLVILIVTGVYLTFFFVPASEEVVYHGEYAPMEGIKMSAAYASTLDISFGVRAGLVMRQMHHWAALVFIAALVVHLCRVFFTGAFRRPREINWMIGVTLLLLSIANGFFGYSLLDDLLSGTGVRVAYSIALSVPVIGTWLAFLFFGGEFPAVQFIPRFFVLHVMLLPALIVGLLTAHLAILWRQKHTQFPGPGRSEDNIVGSRLWPTYALKSVGLFFIVAAVLAGLGGLAQINPVWLYGPYDPAQAAASTAGSQPDWYVGWLDGALRIMPAWEIRAFGFTVANPFFPGALLPGLTF
ncbi:MAG TPA: cytochrome b, partial [Acidimicrobiales bacterium]|nr:cytochrome b [Acidimicrobiales bacterium]